MIVDNTSMNINLKFETKEAQEAYQNNSIGQIENNISHGKILKAIC